MSNEEQLRALIEEINRKALSNEFTPHEISELRELVPQIKSMLEIYKFWQKVLKSVAAFLIGGSGILGIIQLVDKIMEWMKR